MCYFIDNSWHSSLGFCVSTPRGGAGGKNIAKSSGIKRKSRRIEKSNGFHPSQTSSLSSLTPLRSSSPLHFRRTGRKTFSHKTFLSCCRWHVAGNRYKERVTRERRSSRRQRTGRPFICIPTIVPIDGQDRISDSPNVSSTFSIVGSQFASRYRARMWSSSIYLSAYYMCVSLDEETLAFPSKTRCYFWNHIRPLYI